MTSSTPTTAHRNTNSRTKTRRSQTCAPDTGLCTAVVSGNPGPCSTRDSTWVAEMGLMGDSGLKNHSAPAGGVSQRNETVVQGPNAWGDALAYFTTLKPECAPRRRDNQCCCRKRAGSA